MAQMADREEGFILPTGRPFESAVPLLEVIAASTGISSAGKKAMEQYEYMAETLGPEFSILRQIPIEDIRKTAGPLIAEGIGRLRKGNVSRTPGFDGEYGKISLLTKEDISSLEGQMSLFTTAELKALSKPQRSAERRTAKEGDTAEASALEATITPLPEVSPSSAHSLTGQQQNPLPQDHPLSVQQQESRLSASTLNGRQREAAEPSCILFL